MCQNCKWTARHPTKHRGRESSTAKERGREFHRVILRDGFEPRPRNSCPFQSEGVGFGEGYRVTRSLSTVVGKIRFDFTRESFPLSRWEKLSLFLARVCFTICEERKRERKNPRIRVPTVTILQRSVLLTNESLRLRDLKCTVERCNVINARVDPLARN